MGVVSASGRVPIRVDGGEEVHLEQEGRRCTCTPAVNPQGQVRAGLVVQGVMWHLSMVHYGRHPVVLTIVLCQVPGQGVRYLT